MKKWVIILLVNIPVLLQASGVDSLALDSAQLALLDSLTRSFTLQEVVVTAEESTGKSSASVINKEAMQHLQPSSFTDILQTLPGATTKDPDLTHANTIRLREANPMGSDYATSSLGTSFLVDGAPISTNANMQYVSGAWETAAGDRDNTNAGVDMRTLSTDDIERVEIVRGIPSVEYGDLTSGLVKIERRKGGHDLHARLKSDMGSKLFYLAKAFEWDHAADTLTTLRNRTTLNISADYLNSKADPRNPLNNYSRVTFSARLGHTWHRAHYDLLMTTNLDYTGSFDGEKLFTSYLYIDGANIKNGLAACMKFIGTHN